VHLNPDHFLETPSGRQLTPERNAWAWEQCYAALPVALKTAAASGGKLYVMIGAQASGKSTWARGRKLIEPNCVIFDAILVRKSERAPILKLARQHDVPAIAVEIQTPLEVCIARNSRRPRDEMVHEQALRNVMSAIEPPTEQEGFASILVLHYSAA
jgi:predicted kinase